MLQHVPLNIMTAADQTSKYDLPISPAFALFTSPVQDAPIAKGDQAIFRLKKDVYNTITSNNLPTSVMCKYMSHTTYEVAEFSGDVGHRCQIHI